MSRTVRYGCHVQIHQAFARIAGGTKVDLVLVDGRPTRAHLIDKRKQRASERHQFAQLVPAQERQRGLKKRFGRGVGIRNVIVCRNHDYRMRKRVEDGICNPGRNRTRFGPSTHVGFLPMK